MPLSKTAKKNFWIALGLCVIVLAVTFFSKDSSKRPPPESPVSTPSSVSKKPESCHLETKSWVMPDESMMPRIKKGQKLTLTQGWYGCHSAVPGEIVLFRFSKQLDPVVRFVRAAAGDRFSLKADKAHKAWNIAINGKLLLVADGGAPFFFGSESPPLLSLYEKNHAKGLEGDEALVFGAQSQGRFDSGELGLVSSSDFQARVEIKD